MTTYWHMQIHPDDQSFSDENLYSILENKKIIGLGDWKEGQEVISTFINKFSVHDKFHRTLILSGFCLLKIAKISLNSSFFPKPIKR